MARYKHLLILVFVLSLLSSFASAILQDNILSYWNMDNASVTGTTLIDELNNHNLTLVNNIDGQTGILNEARNLFGTTDYMNFTDMGIFDGNYNFSISIWMNADNWEGQDRNIIDLRGEVKFLCQRDDAINKIKCGGDAGGGYSYALETGTTTATGEWIHIVATYDEVTNNLSLYRNGTFQSNISRTGFAVSANENIIGASATNPATSEFDGMFDEMGVWNRTLSATEVSTLFGAGSPPAYPFAYNIESETYTSSVVEGELSGFYINLSSSNYNFTSVELVWNGTYYNTTQISNGSNWTYNGYNLTIPSIASDTSINFYWRVNLTNITNNISSNTGVRTQTIYQIYITNCSSGNETLHFFIANEENVSQFITADFEAVFILNYSAGIRNLSFDLSGQNNYTFCINPANVTYTANATISYGATGYSIREYYLTEVSLTNTSQNITLYLMNSSLTTDVYFLVNDLEFQPVPYVIVKMLRYYVGDNQFRTIEESRTDINGYSIGRLVENDVNYKFILEYEGNVVLETSAMRIVCLSTPCEKEFIISLDDYVNYFQNFYGIDGVTYSTNWNNNTKIFSFTFNDATGSTPTIRFYVNRDSITGNTTICNNTLTSTAGTLNCNLSVYNDGTFFWQGGRATSPEVIFAWGSLSIDEVWRIYGDEGVFWSYMMLLTFGAMGLANAGIGVALIVLGSIGVSYLQWVNFTYYIMALITIMGLIVLSLMRKREVS